MRNPETGGIAIVGMACIYPGARDLQAYWNNIARGVDSISEVPSGRWDAEFFDPQSTSIDRLYCNRGGFIDDHADFDPARWGIMPVAAESSEPDQLLALQVAARALDDAGYGEREFPRASTGVILGRGGYIGAGVARFSSRIRNCEELILALRTLAPQLPDETIRQVRENYRAQAGHHGPDTVIGIVPNLTASRIANRLDLHGPAYTVDAACASSLIAVDHACNELRSGRADVVLAGGVHLVHDVSFWSVFCQLGALSRRQQIRPFDRDADGILIGEGVGVLVLKRLEDARTDGDRIYAVVRGSGVASDGRAASLLTPAVEGQLLALQRAWSAAGLDPTERASVGLIEAHGTATHAGDLAELTTLRRFFGDRADGPISIGSVKSMIGHTMPAAGAAGLIKAALAVHHAVKPPTLHCEIPHEALTDSRFRPQSTAEPWSTEGERRRAGVNAFGFGGINAHVLIEAPECEAPRAERSIQVGGSRPPLLALAAENPAELLARFDRGERGGGRGPCRVAAIDPDQAQMQQVRKAIERGKPYRGRRGVWFTPRGLVDAGGKLAFLFPGVDAEFRPQVEDVRQRFGLSWPDLPEFAGRPTQLEQLGAEIMRVNDLLTRVMHRLGIVPDAIAGHSIGEWSAMVAAGLLAMDDVQRLVSELKPGTLEVPGVVFAAVGCGSDRATPLLNDLEGVVVSHDNCPHQIVICGPESQVVQGLSRLKGEGVLCQKLDFRSGFHTPLFRDYVRPLDAAFRKLPLHGAATPLWSATTCRPYPDRPEAIRRLFCDHLAQPVRFRQLLDAMYDDGVRLFVQVGTGSLIGFVGDALKDRPHMAVESNSARRPGLDQLRRALVAMWVEGVPLQLGELFESSAPRSGTSMRLRLGAPLVRLQGVQALNGSVSQPPAGEHASPVVAQFFETLAAIEQSGRDVVEAWTRPRAASTEKSSWTRRFDFSAEPYLLDHCFFPQPAGWHDQGDRFPVVPMTMSLELLADAARKLVGDRPLVRIERVRALRWIVVEQPLEVKIEAKRISANAVRVKLVGHLEGVVHFADRYREAPLADDSPIEGRRPLPMTPEEMYSGRWMFHGPAYQGVTAITEYGAREIRGLVEHLPAPGALLDSAGQLFGLWIMLEVAKDRMAIPVFIASLEYFGPPPEHGTRFDCRVRIDRCGDARVRANLELAREGRVWCRIEGWEDRRFETDERLWSMMQAPDVSTLSREYPRIPNCQLFDFDFRRTSTRDYFARRYLDREEIAAYRAMNPRKQLEWLPGRIAAKDAVRRLLWSRGESPMFPIEVAIGKDARGRPEARCRGQRLSLSIAHKPGLAGAMASLDGPLGFDIERVEPRDDAFERAAFSESETARFPEGDRDLWRTVFWTAKEATGKLRGSGLEGAPRRLAVRDFERTRLRVDDQWVSFHVDDDVVYAWTECD